MSPGPRHRGLTTMRALFTGNKEGTRSLMVLRVKPTPTRIPTNRRSTPMDNTHYCGLVKNGIQRWRGRASHHWRSYKPHLSMHLLMRKMPHCFIDSPGGAARAEMDRILINTFNRNQYYNPLPWKLQLIKIKRSLKFPEFASSHAFYALLHVVSFHL